MKLYITIILLLFGFLCCANMASPPRHSDGTLSSSAFSSYDIDILKENIHITLNKNFGSALYVVEYLIKTKISGNQIPLLFNAKDYEGNFKVLVDNQVTKLLNIPNDIQISSNSPFQKFSISLEGLDYHLQDLKYFEINLTKGEHIIRIEYKANFWTQRLNWVNEYCFRYDLSPAKLWKSFGSLEITLDASNFSSHFSTNLGKPISGKLESIAKWKFNKLPSNEIIISYIPHINLLGEILITIRPLGLSLVISLIILLCHAYWLKRFRKSFPAIKYSWEDITLRIIIPFLILLFYCFSFDLIDIIIGPEAVKYHGYVYFTLVLYPLVLFVYWMIMISIDNKIKKRLQKIQ